MNNLNSLDELAKPSRRITKSAKAAVMQPKYRSRVERKRNAYHRPSNKRAAFE